MSHLPFDCLAIENILGKVEKRVNLPTYVCPIIFYGVMSLAVAMESVATIPSSESILAAQGHRTTPPSCSLPCMFNLLKVEILLGGGCRIHLNSSVYCSSPDLLVNASLS
jgi:hypothetical protein